MAHWKGRINDQNGLEGGAFFAVGRCLVDLVERIEFHHPVEREASLHEQAYQVWDELLRYAVSLADASGAFPVDEQSLTSNETRAPRCDAPTKLTLPSPPRASTD